MVKIQLTTLSLMLLCFASTAETVMKPLKIFILAGQSNMEGHAKIETFDYIGDDKSTASMLKDMLDSNQKPKVCERVWISYFTGFKKHGEGYGKLTAGYGARSNPTKNGGKIGPEYMFGITMENSISQPILIIKTAWGGKSLNTDFRSPSAGPYELPKKTLKMFLKNPGGHGVPKDLEQWKMRRAAATGHYYRLMMKHIKYVLSDIKRVVPSYSIKQGYELAGFVWFQGWNDSVDGHTYPESHKEGGYKLYSDLMAHFIRDVRSDLSAPKMPFIIGVMGVGGLKHKKNYFRQAMAAPAEFKEFKNNVVAVETAPFWDEDLAAVEAKHGKVSQMAYFLRSKHKHHANKNGDMSKQEQHAYIQDYRNKLITKEDEALWKRGASNAGYHYLGCAKTMAGIGKAFAEALLGMQK